MRKNYKYKILKSLLNKHMIINYLKEQIRYIFRVHWFIYSQFGNMIRFLTIDTLNLHKK
jgi:hypothetical protein